MSHKFKPKDGQRYWYIDGTINWMEIQVVSDSWDDSFDSNYSNCFRTKKDALLALNKIKRILNDKS